MIYSSVFYPSTGGMETVAEVLANEFYRLGHQVDVVTTTPLEEGNLEKDWPFPVYRNPSLWSYWKLVKKSDVILHNCVSLKQLFPDLLYRKKVFVMHQTWYRTKYGSKNLSSVLKRTASIFMQNCFISKAVEKDLGLPGRIIPNTYDSVIFNNKLDCERVNDFIFLGRLVSDKGCRVLLEALKRGKENVPSFEPKLTVIGDGPEREDLEAFAGTHLPNQVRFVGKLQGNGLAALLNQHQIMVVPSLWEEPFGVVALEGLACGCLVIGSEKGGLKDAIGPCGWTFPNGDAQALAELMVKVVTDRSDWEDKYAAIPDHLFNHQPAQIAQAYLDYFKARV